MMGITLKQATDMAAVGIATAAQLGVRVAIAVVDGGGHPVAFMRMDGCQWGSVEVASAKARCAVAFRRATKIWEQRVGQEKPGYLTMPGILALEGGIPLLSPDGEAVCGVGVSGALSSQDGEIAAAMLASLASI